MAVEFLAEGRRVYVKVNGVIGDKASKNLVDAKRYADRVDRGLAMFTPLSSSAVKNITLNRIQIRNGT